MTRSTPLLTRVRAARLGGASLDELAEIVSSGAVPHDGPVPIELVYDRLGIGAVVVADLEGASGVLLQDVDLPKPLIAVRASDPMRRRRFSIAHELAHLVLGHLDLGRAPDKAEEADADRLAALLLAPPRRVTEMLRDGPPDVRDVRRVADAFEISVDAAARAVAEWHPDPVAVVIARDGRVERCYGRRSDFPRLAVSIGDPLPPGSVPLQPSGTSASSGPRVRGPGDGWVCSSRAYPRPVLEQVLRWRSGGSLIVLSFEHAGPLSRPS